MPVIVNYDSGFPTRLLKQSRLEKLILDHGHPVFDDKEMIWVFSNGEKYIFKNPWNDNRKVVSFQVVPFNEGDKIIINSINRKD